MNELPEEQAVILLSLRRICLIEHMPRRGTCLWPCRNKHSLHAHTLPGWLLIGILLSPWALHTFVSYCV